MIIWTLCILIHCISLFIKWRKTPHNEYVIAVLKYTYCVYQVRKYKWKLKKVFKCDSINVKVGLICIIFAQSTYHWNYLWKVKSNHFNIYKLNQSINFWKTYISFFFNFENSMNFQNVFVHCIIKMRTVIKCETH